VHHQRVGLRRVCDGSADDAFGCESAGEVVAQGHEDLVDAETAENGERAAQVGGLGGGPGAVRAVVLEVGIRRVAELRDPQRLAGGVMSGKERAPGADDRWQLPE
jgi:hypothetical protein